MTFTTTLIHEIESDKSGKQAIQTLLKCSEADFSELLATAWNIRQKNFDPVLHCFYPGDLFPAISITGSQCALHCKHCNKHYLSLMIPAERPEKLWEVCKNLEATGKIGCLISGGYNEQAMLPFEQFIPVIKQIKDKTKLVLNVHTGLVSREIALKLGEAGVDIVSFDVVGDEKTIQEMYGLKKSPENYLQSLKFLRGSKIRYIVPHICIGLNQGRLEGEIRALTLIKGTNPDIIVFLGLIPTENTPIQNLLPPSPKEIAKIIATARLLFPTIPLSLGCMRPGKIIRNEIDKLAIQAGVNRIEIPTQQAIQYAIQKGLQIQKHSSCCATPLKLL
ncbi:MAG: radical SAM protein [Candidatus Helarchaeota archaeon]|nr:radical SAM protein [Candidatus Helarchaeota archaeon]